ncbi:MAG: hypothetical protein MJZ87_07200 [Bacteroidales bacterium]|nr:hypothetical protein [Bacteroidales bacterium]
MQNLLLEFRPAKVVSRKETYVSYYVVDPTTDTLKRLRVRCNHVKGRRERLKYATALCSEINRKLFSGWNPLTGTEPSEKRSRKLLAAAQEFCSTHSRNLRPDSQRSYRSKLKLMVLPEQPTIVQDESCSRRMPPAGRFFLTEN